MKVEVISAALRGDRWRLPEVKMAFNKRRLRGNITAWQIMRRK